MYLVYLYIFIFSICGFAAEQPSVHEPDLDFEVIHDNDESSKEAFALLSEHNSLIPAKVRTGLIAKGYHLIHQIKNGVTFDQIHHTIEFFPHGGCEYVDPKMTLVHKLPTMGSLGRFCSSILGGKDKEREQKTLKRRAQLESLIAIVWAMADYAFKLNQGFSSGSFSVIDPNGDLFNFFAQYALEVNQVSSLNFLPYGSFNPINPQGNPFAYNRDPQSPIIQSSSHYKDTTLHQIGIDARFESNAYTLSVFPYQATHILVGRVKTLTGLEKTIVKFEPYGTGTISAWIAHATEFIRSLSDRDNKRSEKDIPENIEGAFKEMISHIINAHLEIPPSQNNEIINLMIHHLNDLLNDQELKKFDLSSWTYFAFHILKSIDHLDPVIQNSIGTFLNQLEAKYHDGLFDNDPHVFRKGFYRTGNEFVVNLDEIE